MFNFYILLKNVDTKEKIIQEVEGYKLPHGLFAFKDEKSWTISDVQSGTSVITGLSKYSDIASHLKDENFLDKVRNVRNTERYSRVCEITKRLIQELNEPKEVSLWEDVD